MNSTVLYTTVQHINIHCSDLHVSVASEHMKYINKQSISTHTYRHAHTHTHTHTHTYIHAHTHIYRHAHTHARTHTHTHVGMCDGNVETPHRRWVKTRILQTIMMCKSCLIHILNTFITRNLHCTNNEVSWDIATGREKFHKTKQSSSMARKVDTMA